MSPLLYFEELDSACYISPAMAPGGVAVCLEDCCRHMLFGTIKAKLAKSITSRN